MVDADGEDGAVGRVGARLIYGLLFYIVIFVNLIDLCSLFFLYII